MLLLCVAAVVGLVAGVVGCRGSRTRSRSRSPPSLFAAAAARYGTFLRSVYQVQSIDSLCPPLVPPHPYTFLHSSAAPSSGVLLMLVIAAAAAPVPATAAVRVALCCCCWCCCSLVVAVEIFTTYVWLFHYL